MELTLTRKQEEGLKLAVKRYKDGERYTVIAGYAGTGKSTLIKFIVSALDLNPDFDVCYIAYTGKAALVLKDKGCPNAMTAHRLLYDSFPRNDGTFYHKIRRPIPAYKLIIVDEVSMLPKEMWDLLLSHNIHVIALGDPAQLPPVASDNNILQTPHIFLDEIMRQEAESEIIRLTMDIRAGKRLLPYKGSQVQVIDKHQVIDGMFTWADQVIVGKNTTRRNYNQRMRKLIHDVDDPAPIEGDRVICLRNYWENANGYGDVMVNGSIGTIHNIQYSHHCPFYDPAMKVDFMPDGYDEDKAMFPNLLADYKLLNEGSPTITAENWRKIPKLLHPVELDYGYVITCHKSQGSEYPKVLVFEEYLNFAEHQRWLYTAATRASEKLVIVRA